MKWYNINKKAGKKRQCEANDPRCDCGIKDNYLNTSRIETEYAIILCM